MRVERVRQGSDGGRQGKERERDRGGATEEGERCLWGKRGREKERNQLPSSNLLKRKWKGRPFKTMFDQPRVVFIPWLIYVNLHSMD